ncbi:MAG: hypothetical protein EA359_16665 [Balneolaceae bacterium]|nr:MAG: hypothetical protein EA359_16665 [Balneolaceae bacterium]
MNDFISVISIMKSRFINFSGTKLISTLLPILFTSSGNQNRFPYIIIHFFPLLPQNIFYLPSAKIL